jgi:hypothetical protein
MRITLTIIFLGLIFSIGAQTYLRVSNNPGAIADYTNLQTAIDNAPVGATIFVEPSTTTYGSITINKRLIFLGGGYDVTKHSGKISQIGIVSFSKQTSDPSGTLLSGFYFSSNFGSTSSNSYTKGIDNITIQRCQFANFVIYLTGSNVDSVAGWKIMNCKLYQITATYSKDILISNNVIGSNVTGFNQYSVFITNNVFTSSSSNNNSFTSYANNIFYSGIPTNCSNCTFSNNLTTSASSLNYGDNVAVNNTEGIANTNIFVAYSTDLHLKSTCPGVSAGSDGKDIGIYGGLFPFPDEDYGVTGYPEVSSMSITNPVVEPNGTLKVKVKTKITH